MKITVTTEDIRSGKACNPWQCPIAKAVTRQVPNTFVEVGSAHVVIDNEYVPLPEHVVDFIAAFDGKLPTGVAPFEFEVPYETREAAK